MPSTKLVRSTPIKRSVRVQKIESIFDLGKRKESTVELNINLPIESLKWNVGLIVGPSGCGKSTVLREFFSHGLADSFTWSAEEAIVDAFPRGMPIADVTALLSSVGFSSPPSWLRPFHVLSNGEQFRATVARALAQNSELCAVDEFTSVIDRQVAQIASAAVAKAVRRRSQKLVAASCHYDVIEWLDPDWVYEPAVDRFQRRSLHGRPRIKLEVSRCNRSLWRYFRQHHYLSAEICKVCAQCFVATVNDRPAAFTAVMHFPHPKRPGYREHRTVCMPDFQGVGIGNAMSEFIAGCFRARNKPYRSATSHPGMMAHRQRSPLWKMTRKPGLMTMNNNVINSTIPVTGSSWEKSSSWDRITATFEYVGPVRFEEAKVLKIV